MILALITNIIKQKVVLKDKRSGKTAYSSSVYAIRTLSQYLKPHQTDKNSNGFKLSVFFIHKTLGRLKTLFRRPDSNKIIFSVSPLGAPHHKRAPNGRNLAWYKLA